MPVDLIEKGKKELREFEDGQQKFEHFQKVTILEIQQFLKQNVGYSYTIDEIQDLFPESKEGFCAYAFIEKIPGVLCFDGGYSYYPSSDPCAEEYKKRHPMPAKKKGFWKSLLG